MDADFYEQHNPRFVSPEANPEDPLPAVPAELKALPQWVLWKTETRGGKPTKVPYQANQAKAQSNNPNTWTDYQSACQSYVRHDRYFDGIGFVFSHNDGYTGIDLDNCIVNGELTPWAKEIVETFSTAYKEVSPSGNGIKMWTRAELPSQAKHKVYINPVTDEAIEAYDKGRYFTVTGKGKHQIGEGQQAVDWLSEKYLIPDRKPAPQTTPARPATSNRNTTEVKQLVDNSRQRGKYHALMAGHWKQQGYGSHSEGDMGLIQLLCFWTQEARSLDAIFRESALYRPKWDEKHRADGATYGEMTIEKALSQSRETYTPPREQKPKHKRRASFYEKRAQRRRYGKGYKR